MTLPCVEPAVEPCTVALLSNSLSGGGRSVVCYSVASQYLFPREAYVKIINVFVSYSNNQKLARKYNQIQIKTHFAFATVTERITHSTY